MGTLSATDQVFGVRPGFEFGTDDGGLRVLRQVRDFAPDLTVIDPLIKVIGGIDENDSGMAQVMTRIERIRDELAGAVLLVHHPSRGRSASSGGDAGRGASAVPGATDGNLTLIKRGESHFLLSGSMRDTNAFSVELQRDPGTMIYSVADSASGRRTVTTEDVRAGVVELGPLSVTELALHLDCSDTLVRMRLSDLKGTGAVIEVARTGREVRYGAAA